MSTDPVIQFRDAMGGAGLSPPDVPIADGELHRFHVEGDKSGSTSGWYVLYGDGIPAGRYGCWKRDIKEKWCAKASTEMSDAERGQWQKQMEAAQAKRKAETSRRQSAHAQPGTARYELDNHWANNSLHGQVFDRKSIGEKRYNAVSVSASRALKRLTERHLLYQSGYGWSLTEHGLETAKKVAPGTES